MRFFMQKFKKLKIHLYYKFTIATGGIDMWGEKMEPIYFSKVEYVDACYTRKRNHG